MRFIARRPAIASKKAIRALSIAAAILYCALLAYVSLMPVRAGSALGATPSRRLVNNLLHIPAYALLAGLFALSLRHADGAMSNRRILAGAAAAVAFGGLMELGQVFVPGRYGGWDDVALNSLGAAAFVGVLMLRKRRGRKGEAAGAATLAQPSWTARSANAHQHDYNLRHSVAEPKRG